MINPMVRSYLSVVSDILNSRGLPCVVKYSSKSPEDEWRKLTEKVNTPESNEDWTRPGKGNQILITYSRSVARKSSLLGRRKAIISQFDSPEGVQANESLYLDVDVTINLTGDNVATMDVIEVLLLSKLANRDFAITSDIKLAPDVEHPDTFEYNVSVGTLEGYNDISNSNLRTLSITASLSGVVIVPFYVRNDPITSLCIEVWAFDKQVDPLPTNIDRGDFCFRAGIKNESEI